MISVLIPVYNYNIVALVKELHRQLTEAKVIFEILAHDSGSEARFIELNKQINTFKFTNYNPSKMNVGREQTRQVLAQKAEYNWLLFLDADTMPANLDFIKIYLSYLTSNYDAVFGGILYDEKKPENDSMLRWIYGHQRETITAEIRTKKPYRTIVSANFSIRKEIFINLNGQISGKGYGYDVLFSSLLKSHSIKVAHIDNQVVHLGIEKSHVYLTKTEEAINILLKLYKEGRIDHDDNGLVGFCTKLKKYQLHHAFAYFYRKYASQMKSHLLGKNPSIYMIQLYRISYMCYNFKRDIVK
ncbi:glycosyltransferase family 2 protein [Gelidibacter mesophilus]|uniref:glycosyltransferase family 2 protein n=1 Tax=Gelidibacter mesophilus TaxID=169050 RepID=UPI0003F5799E|nr:glycosyltransferase family 2 protein [Gelidibacter mesophilus]